MLKNVRGALGFSEHPFFCKTENDLKGGPFGDINFGQGRNSNPRSSLVLKKRKVTTIVCVFLGKAPTKKIVLKITKTEIAILKISYS